MTNREIFNEWFLDLLQTQPTCLMRDVLRDSKEDLYKNWLIRKPLGIDASEGKGRE